MDTTVNIKDILMPAAIAGAIGAALHYTPFYFLNILCCGLIIATGALSTYLIKSMKKVDVDPKTGAIAGAISGAIAAFVESLFYSALIFIFASMGFFPIISFGRNFEPIHEIAAYGSIWIVITIAIAAAFILIGVFFGAIGGVLAAKYLEQKKN